MSPETFYLGDSLPPVPAHLRWRESSNPLGSIFYTIRSAILKLSHPIHKPGILPNPDEIKHLLVVQVERLGDLVLAEPAFRALHDHFPNAVRILLAADFARPLFNQTGWDDFLSPRDLVDIAAKRRHFDLVVDLTGRLELNIARSLARSGIPIRVGLDRGGRGIYYTISVPHCEISIPTREIYLKIVSALGVQAKDAIPCLPKDEARLKRGARAWKDRGLHQPVVLLPGAYYPEQRWAAGKFAQVGKLLRNEGVEVAVICGPGEEGLGGAVAHEVGIPLIAAAPLNELLDLLATVTVVVCNNSGPLHLAAALGIPTVSTMGPTVPWRWWPLSTAPAFVFRGGTDEPRGNMEKILPAQVFEAVRFLLREKRSDYYP